MMVVVFSLLALLGFFPLPTPAFPGDTVATACLEDPEEGKLEEFEKAASKEEDDARSKEAKDEDEDQYHDDDDGSLSGTIFTIVFLGVACGGVESWYRAKGVEDQTWWNDVEARALGDPELPFVRVDLSYMDMGSDVTGSDVLGEAGYGPFGFDFRFTHFTEELPSDELDFIQWHGLYRMSFSRYVTANLGFGALTLSGHDRNTGFSMSLPVQVYPVPAMSLWSRSQWAWVNAGTVSDQELGLAGHLRFISAVAGYRWVSTEDRMLRGPFVGLAGHF